MPSLLIYLPGKQGASPKLLEDAGLGDLLDGGSSPSFFQLDGSRGPDGGGGAVAYWGHALPDVGAYLFEPAKGRNPKSTIHDPRSKPGGAGTAGAAASEVISPGAACPVPVEGRAPSPARFWLGRPREDRLTPADLARPKLQLGADVVLADGHVWHVPIARQLPQLLGLNDAGEWTGVVVPQYRAFYDAAWAALDWLAPDETGVCRVDAQQGADFAAAALSINYRINRDVASFLGLLTSESIFEVSRAVIEFDAIVAAGAAAQKKTAAASDTPASAAGPPA